MKIANAEEMREIDRRTIAEFGVPGCELMERAGAAVVRRIKQMYGKRKVVVISGSGNNGGDGIVAGWIMKNEGYDVKVVLMADPEKIKGDAKTQYQTALNHKVPFFYAAYFIENTKSFFLPNTVIVDALFGTGLSRDISGGPAKIVEAVNSSGLPVVSVDIPSGISSDTGQILGISIKADCTVTFGLPKRGHFLYPGAENTGRLFVENIGFPESLLSSDFLKTELVEEDMASLLIPERKKYSHKGDYGHVLLIAGSRGKTGAALMAAQACLRAGAGLVTIGVPESLADVFQSRVTEEMTLILPDRGDGSLSEKALGRIMEFIDKSADITAIGPGIGVSKDTEKIVKGLIKKTKSPLVIDADGLNSIKGDKAIFNKSGTQIILTPHPGEMAKLMNTGRDEIEKDRISAAVAFAGETGTHVVLKGVPTVISAPDGRAYVNSTGNPGMATAGTGDVLTGIISGFLAQRMTPINAAILGVYMHGLSGDKAAHEKGMHSLTATDVINNIPEAFKKLRQFPVPPNKAA